jgi:hypothetical protein
MAVIALAVSLTYVGTSEATGRYSRKSLKGTYGFSGSGTLGFGTVQTAVAGLNSFDGDGRCDIKARLNAGGAMTSLTTARCSYTVNGDGTGYLIVTFNEPPFGPFRSDFVIVQGTNEVHFVLSDMFGGGTVASGVAKRQTPAGDTD